MSLFEDKNYADKGYALVRYKIVRYYFRSNTRRTLRTGVTLQEAIDHCGLPDSSSQTARGLRARWDTWWHGRWFDGYIREES